MSRSLSVKGGVWTEQSASDGWNIERFWLVLYLIRFCQLKEVFEQDEGDSDGWNNESSFGENKSFQPYVAIPIS